MKNTILFVHTTGKWWESRYYYKQIPALRRAGYEVFHLIKDQDTEDADSTGLIKCKTRLLRISGGLTLLITVLKTKSDIIQICNLETLPLGIILSIIFNKKVFYDCIEDHYNSMLYSKTQYPKLIRKVFAKFVLFLEKIAAKCFSGIITSDPYLFNYHDSMHSGKNMLFYNMPALRDFTETSINKTDKKYDLVVLGSMSIRTGVLDVIKAIGEIKNNRIVTLKLIGNPYKDNELEFEINKSIKKFNLKDQIYITGELPFKKIPIELSSCKIGVIPLLDYPKFQNNIAMKQWEYMAVGLAVLATDLKPQTYFIENDVNGKFYKPGNIEELKMIILDLLNTPDKITEMGEDGKKKVRKEWNSESQEDKYIDYYQKRLRNEYYYESQIF